MTDLGRVWIPPPQSSEHLSQLLDQPETLQSIGHMKVSQVLESVKEGQPAPLYAGALTTERERRLNPLSQVLEQGLNLVQVETLQSIVHLRWSTSWCQRAQGMRYHWHPHGRQQSEYGS